MGIAYDENDADGVSSLEDFCVSDFILPGRVEKFLETSEVEASDFVVFRVASRRSKRRMVRTAVVRR